MLGAVSTVTTVLHYPNHLVTALVRSLRICGLAQWTLHVVLRVSP